MQLHTQITPLQTCRYVWNTALGMDSEAQCKANVRDKIWSSYSLASSLPEHQGWMLQRFLTPPQASVCNGSLCQVPKAFSLQAHARSLLISMRTLENMSLKDWASPSCNSMQCVPLRDQDQAREHAASLEFDQTGEHLLVACSSGLLSVISASTLVERKTCSIRDDAYG